jgi:hypothetical protein
LIREARHGTVVVIIKPRGLEKHDFGNILCPSADDRLLFHMNDIARNIDRTEFVATTPRYRSLVVAEDDLADQLAGIEGLCEA